MSRREELDIEGEGEHRLETDVGLLMRLNRGVGDLPLTMCDKSLFTSENSSMSSEVRVISCRNTVSLSSSVMGLGPLVMPGWVEDTAMANCGDVEEEGLNGRTGVRDLPPVVSPRVIPRARAC